MYRVTREPRSVANANHYLITYPVRLLNISCLIVSLYFPNILHYEIFVKEASEQLDVIPRDVRVIK